MQSFILFVIFGQNRTEAEKYAVEFSFEDENKEKHTFERGILSIEDFHRAEIVPSSKCVVLSQTVAKKFLSITKNIDDSFYTVHLPIVIEKVTVVDDEVYEQLTDVEEDDLITPTDEVADEVADEVD